MEAERKMRKKSKMVKALVLASILSLAVTGCGNTVEVAVENTSAPEVVEETVDGAGTEESAAVQEEEQTIPEEQPEQTKQETQAESVELAAGFDEEFALSMDEELVIGREGISIKLNWIDWDEYGTTFGSLFLSIFWIRLLRMSQYQFFI